MIFRVKDEQSLLEKILPLITSRLKGGFRCGIIGELGAGKTTLVRGIGRALSVKQAITSPSFNLCKLYRLPRPVRGAKLLQHIDLYRFERPGRLDLLEISEWLDNREAITFVEWPEKAGDFLGRYDLFVEIRQGTESGREVELRWN